MVACSANPPPPSPDPLHIPRILKSGAARHGERFAWIAENVICLLQSSHLAIGANFTSDGSLFQSGITFSSNEKRI